MLKRLRSQRPSAATVIAIIAVVVAASGTAVAASHLVRGDRLIKKHSLSGNRLRNHTITGKQVNLKKLGKVPSARHADTADTATNASNANTVGGRAASAFLGSGSRIGSAGIVRTSGSAGGTTVPVYTVGPFTVTMTCTKNGSGTTLSLNAKSSEANSDIDGSIVAANTSTNLDTLGPGTTFQTTNNVNDDFEAPSGAEGILEGADGINSLGTDCWANWTGIR
jgi:hypothetical protein